MTSLSNLIAAREAALGAANQFVIADVGPDEFAAVEEAAVADAPPAAKRPVKRARLPDAESAEQAASVAPVKRVRATPASAVAPPRFEFDSKTLGGRPLPADRGQFRAVFENAKVLGDVLGALAALSSMFPITFTPDGITVRLVDSSNVIYFVVKIPRDALLVYENAYATATTVVVSSVAFQTRKSQFVPTSTMTFAFQTAPADARDLIVQIYPASGVARDGIVSRFTVPLSDAKCETLPEALDATWYQCEITIALALLLRTIACFKASMGSLALTVTDHSLDFAGRCDENSGQTLQVSFVSGDAPAESLLAERPHNCHRASLTDGPEPHIVNYRLSLMYLRRAVVSLVGCRYVRLALGRCNGEFTPLRIAGTYVGATGATICTTQIYISPEVEADN